MHEDLEEVADIIRQFSSDYRAEHDLFHAAQALIMHFFGKYIINSEITPDRVTGKGVDIRSINTPGVRRYTVRMVHLAETLFDLRHQPGFPNLLDRIKFAQQAQLPNISRRAGFECTIAALFCTMGYAIHARKEVNKIKEDYDFTAVSSSERINVEVTTLKNREFSPNSIKNALKQKKRQLPEDNPAVIAVVLPGRWFSPENMESAIEVANAFLRGTKRPNYVIYYWHMVLEEPGILLQYYSKVRNPDPRHSAPMLDKVLGEPYRNLGDIASADPASVQPAFIKWVISILNPSSSPAHSDVT